MRRFHDQPLLGDPQQLAQVAQGGHPEQTAVSALGHLLGVERTMPVERGLFIDVSRRMHPDVGRFVSEISYAGMSSAARWSRCGS